MARKRVWLGILVVMLVFSMAIVGCDDDQLDQNQQDEPGTFTLTDVPSKYFGKYALISGGNDIIELIGCLNWNESVINTTLVSISGNSVNFPMWVNSTGERYLGNHTIYFYFYVFEGPTIDSEGIAVFEYFSPLTVFSNGSAKRSFNDGILSE